MRARELLLEYRRDITAQNYGDAIIKRLATARRGTLHYALQGYAQLLRYLQNPQMYLAVSFRIETPSGVYTIEPNRAEQTAQHLRPDMIADTLSVIEEYDPTPNKEYTVWLLRRWLTDPEQQSVRMEDFNRSDALSAYHVGKRRGLIKPEHKDINRFRTYRQFEDVMFGEYDIDTLLNVEEKTTEADRGKYDEVYKDDSVRVIVPRDERAACFWGRGTRWCTASTRGSNYFNTYNQQGPLYILLPTKRIRPGEKYQIHIPSGQFMNEDDTPVDITNLAQNVFPQFFAWLVEHDREARGLVAFTDDETLTTIWKTIYTIVVDRFKTAAAENAYDDETYMEELENSGALDVDGSIDDVVVDRANLEYWRWNENYRNDLQKLLLVSRLDAAQIRKWSQEGAANFESEYSTVSALPSLFLFVLYETQETRTADILDDNFNYIFVYDESSYARSNKNLRTGQRVELVRRVGPYYVGYLTKP